MKSPRYLLGWASWKGLLILVIVVVVLIVRVVIIVILPKVGNA